MHVKRLSSHDGMPMLVLSQVPILHEELRSIPTWQDSDVKARKSDIKGTWKTWDAARKSAASTWKTTNRSAWSTFRSAVKACHPTKSQKDSAGLIPASEA